MRKVLIVDDNIDEKSRICYIDCFYKDSIKQGKYEVIFAISKEEALKIIEEDIYEEIGLIILELLINFREADGIKLANELAVRGINRPILLYTTIPEYIGGLTEQAKKNVILTLGKCRQSFDVITSLVDSFMTGNAIEISEESNLNKEVKSEAYYLFRNLLRIMSSESRLEFIREIRPLLTPEELLIFTEDNISSLSGGLDE